MDKIIMNEEMQTSGGILEKGKEYPANILPAATIIEWTRMGYCKAGGKDDKRGGTDEKDNNTIKQSDKTAGRKSKG